jgi:CMP/dCMP kinase
VSAGFRGQITLDGPSGTGKSSVARDVARKLGASYLDTGAMYRAATVAVLEAGVSLDDKVAVARAVSEATIAVGTNARREVVTVDGVDVRQRIRGAEVTRAVSPVSAVPAVRRLLVARQRELIAAAEAVVVEGRDIGTVVAPDAPVKVYLTADPEARAARRTAEMTGTTVHDTHQDLIRRDKLDSGRATAPLQMADDAHHIDTTPFTLDEVIDQVVALVREATASVTGGS